MRVRNEPVAFIRATARTRAHVSTRTCASARARARHGHIEKHWTGPCIIRASAHIRKLPLVIVTTRGFPLLLLLPLLASHQGRGRAWCERVRASPVTRAKPAPKPNVSFYSLCVFITPRVALAHTCARARTIDFSGSPCNWRLCCAAHMYPRRRVM